MKEITMGRTGIKVSELCFGLLPIGPLQKNVDVETAGEILCHALKNGVTFVDTAQMYKTYPIVRYAIEKTGIVPVISTKSTAATYEDMEAAIKEAQEAMGIEKIDIFFMHAARMGADLFEIRKGALECLMDYRSRGVIKAIGVSAHGVDLVNASAVHPEIDVVFPIINKRGMGILKGSREEMERAIENCFQNGKGVLFMKVLAGGAMIASFGEAMEYARGLSASRAPIALGMVAQDELEMNLRYFNGTSSSDEINNIKNPGKAFFVSYNLCKSCGKCISKCHSEAIYMGEKHAVINPDKCLTCGYCIGECPEFAIRMV